MGDPIESSLGYLNKLLFAIPSRLRNWYFKTKVWNLNGMEMNWEELV